MGYGLAVGALITVEVAWVLLGPEFGAAGTVGLVLVPVLYAVVGYASGRWWAVLWVISLLIIGLIGDVLTALELTREDEREGVSFTFLFVIGAPVPLALVALGGAVRKLRVRHSGASTDSA
jgi:hypothetical protein